MWNRLAAETVLPRVRFERRYRPNRQRQLLSVDEIEILRTAFHEIYDAIHGQDVFRPIADDDLELKAQIIRKLLEVIEDGTPPTEFKSKVLRSLSFR